MKELRKYAEDELETMLSMEHHIDRLLHKDMLMDLWLNDTKEEVIEEILMSDDY